MDEPTAATIAYGVATGLNRMQLDSERIVLTFDLGGGTTGVTVAAVGGGFNGKQRLLLYYLWQTVCNGYQSRIKMHVLEVVDIDSATCDACMASNSCHYFACRKSLSIAIVLRVLYRKYLNIAIVQRVL
jgi:Hsp70 protein